MDYVVDNFGIKMVNKRNGNGVPWTDYFSDDDKTVIVDKLVICYRILW